MTAIILKKNDDFKSNDAVRQLERKSRMTKQLPRRKRVLAFSDIEDSALVEQTTKHIEQVKEEIKNKALVSLPDWCEERGIGLALVTRLLREADLPIAKIGEFQGVYELHLSRVLYTEVARQFEQQTQNRVCARIVAHRNNAERKQKQKGVTKPNSV